MAAMRGLDARVLLARARVAAMVDEELSEELLIKAHAAAHADGQRDFLYGESRPPCLFEGEPMLSVAWEDGAQHQELSEEMAQCDGCNDSDGAPCSTHG